MTTDMKAAVQVVAVSVVGLGVYYAIQARKDKKAHKAAVANNRRELKNSLVAMAAAEERLMKHLGSEYDNKSLNTIARDWSTEVKFQEIIRNYK